MKILIKKVNIIQSFFSEAYAVQQLQGLNPKSNIKDKYFWDRNEFRHSVLNESPADSNQHKRLANYVDIRLNLGVLETSTFKYSGKLHLHNSLTRSGMVTQK